MLNASCVFGASFKPKKRRLSKNGISLDIQTGSRWRRLKQSGASSLLLRWNPEWRTRGVSFAAVVWLAYLTIKNSGPLGHQIRRVCYRSLTDSYQYSRASTNPNQTFQLLTYWPADILEQRVDYVDFRAVQYGLVQLSTWECRFLKAMEGAE
jgi:hypothetical protein